MRSPKVDQSFRHCVKAKFRKQNGEHSKSIELLLRKFGDYMYLRSLTGGDEFVSS